MSRIQPPITMIFSDSDEEPESVVAPVTRRGLMIEELQYEMEVVKYYRNLLAENRLLAETNNKNNSNCKSPGKQTVSKPVQTDPEASGLPPSWLISVQKLADELHDGLGNLINSYIQTRDLKYMKYENGIWQSTLLPNVAISLPRDFGVNKQVDLKSSLTKLLEKARKLQNMIPDLTVAVYETEMLVHKVHKEKTCECVTEKAKSSGVLDLKNAKQQLLEGEIASTSQSILGGKVAEVTDSLDRVEFLQQRYLPEFESGSHVSQYSDVDNEKAVFGESSAGFRNEHAPSRREHKHLQEKNVNFYKNCKSKPSVEESRYRPQTPYTRKQVIKNEMQMHTIDSKTTSYEANKNGSIAVGAASTSAEPLVAVNKKKIPNDVLADCSNRLLRTENKADKAVSIKGTRNKINPVEERRQENRPPKTQNFIKRNIMALKPAVIKPSTSKSTGKSEVVKKTSSKIYKRN